MTLSAWSSNTAYTLGTVVAPSGGTAAGLAFYCTTAGTSGATEPGWPTSIGTSLPDNTVVWQAVSAVESDLQLVNPSAIIELFELKLTALQHGVDATYRFHAGSSLNANGALVFGGNTFSRMPIQAEGFEYNGKQLPRPTLRVSNLMGTITRLLLSLPNGIEGAQVTRRRTQARYLDAVNFPGSVSPYTPDPLAEWPQEIFFIDRRSAENRNLIEFELAASFDLAGVRGPKRQCLNLCSWAYRGPECGYAPVASFTGTYSRSGTTVSIAQVGHGLTAGCQIYLNVFGGDVLSGYYKVVTAATNSLTVTTEASGTTSGTVTVTQWYSNLDTPVYTSSADACGKRVDSCKKRFGANAALPFGGFPGVGSFYA